MPKSTIASPSLQGDGGPPSTLPVFPFIVGCGRSGTTLLRSMFDSHQEMAIPAETYFVARLALSRGRYEKKDAFAVDLFLKDLVSTGGYRRMDIPDEVLRRRLEERPPTSYAQAIRTVFALYASRQGKVRYGDKTPNYVLNLPLLSDVFPEARFIHIIRDGRDVAKALLDGKWVRRIEDAALHWKLQVQRGRDAGSRIGEDRYIEVRYEDLVGDPTTTLTSLCSFIDLKFDSNMHRYQDSAQRWAGFACDPSRHQNLSRAPTIGLRDWRTQLSRRDLSVLQTLVGDLLSELGYELGEDTPSTALVKVRARSRWVSWQGRRIGHRVRRSLLGTGSRGRSGTADRASMGRR